MKYKVLVADDEWIIRKGIISCLEKYEEFEVVAEAEDGEMALELAQDQHIDTFFIDITMPFMSGLEFVEALRKIQPDALVVIITGYDRFEYAKEAIILGVFDYILKPIQEDVFDDMIHRLLDLLNKLQRSEHYLSWANARLSENRKSLISTFLQKWLNNRLTKEEIVKECDYLKINIPKEYTLILIKLEYLETEDIKNQWNDDLLFFVAQNIAKEIFDRIDNEISCRDDFGNVVLVCRHCKDTEEKKAEYEEMLRTCFPVRCHTAWEDEREPAELGNAYQRAILQLKNLSGGSPIVRDMKLIIEKNYGKKDFSLQDMVTQLNLSAQYLSKVFNREMGCTLVDYLTNLRIRKSIELLQDSDRKIYEVAEAVGYSTQHYFSNVFKKKLGISPVDFRKNLKGDKSKTD